MPRAIAGVADHRGEVIPIVDLRVRFGLPKEQEQRRNKWILVNVQGRIVGLKVDAVTEVFGQAGIELRPAPELGEGDDLRGLSGVITHEGAMNFVLDLDSLEALIEQMKDDSRIARQALARHPDAFPKLGRIPD